MAEGIVIIGYKIDIKSASVEKVQTLLAIGSILTSLRAAMMSERQNIGISTEV
jgi:hypothetical protein